MKKIHANYSNSSHEIIIGKNILHKLVEFLNKKKIKTKLCIITDKNVARYHLDLLLKILENKGINTNVLILNTGEKTKGWFNLKKVTEWLIYNQVERNDYIISFGGGVVGDLVGFSASIVRRGIKIIHIPTTLLAQVDSAIGGKTGINSLKGKNLIGTFYQPSLILSDISFLKTLNKRYFLSGYAEVIKKALIKDHKFFNWLEKKDYSDLIEESILIDLVYKSCKIKVQLVKKDEKEKGERALLNLGHTFAHALESANNYSNNLLHGEAVIIGCCLALELSKELNLIDQTIIDRITKHIKKLKYRTEIYEINKKIFEIDELIKIMYQDKKVENKQLNFVLLENIGKGVICKNVDEGKVKKVLYKSKNCKY